MSFCCSESGSGHDNDNKEDKSEDPEEPVCPQQPEPAVTRREPISVLSKLMDSKGQSEKKTGMSLVAQNFLSFGCFLTLVFAKVANCGSFFTDLMEELGLGDVDDLEGTFLGSIFYKRHQIIFI